MDGQVFPWIDDDVTIEIIGKMIADQNRSLNSILDAFESVGLNESSKEVQTNSDYQFHNERVRSLQAEIRQIYRGEGKAELIDKVNNQYAPYIKGRLKPFKSFDLKNNLNEPKNFTSSPSRFGQQPSEVAISSQVPSNQSNVISIALISTSSRRGSNALRFVNYLRHVLAEEGQYEVMIVSFEDYDIPFIGQGTVRKESLTSFQQELVNVWEAADLVIFAMPEYNWTAPPQATNLIHQLGGPAFKHLFDNKVFAMAGISNGRGGRQPALDMTTVVNKLVSFTNSYSIVSPKLYESHETDKNLDENGHFIGHKLYDRTARAFLTYTLSVGQRWLQPNLVRVK